MAFRAVAYEKKLQEAGVDPKVPRPAEAMEEFVVREIVTRITAALGMQTRVHVTEDEETVTASCAGSELGLLIGKHGQTLDAGGNI